MATTDPKPPATVQLLAQIEGFCHLTGIGLSTFGMYAAGDPHLAFDLYKGRKPRQRVQEQVRAFIARELAA